MSSAVTVVEQVDRDDAAQDVGDEDDVAVGRQVVEDVRHHRPADVFAADISAHLLQAEQIGGVDYETRGSRPSLSSHRVDMAP